MKYKYKIKEQDSKQEIFQAQRAAAFDQIEDMLDIVKKEARKAKLETIRYYRENPDSYGVVYSTDIIKDYLKDVISLLKQDE